MMGITEPTTQRGIIPRAFEHIFETIDVSENTKFLVHASYLEIYNEEIRDLLGKNHKVIKIQKRKMYFTTAIINFIHSCLEVPNLFLDFQ